MPRRLSLTEAVRPHQRMDAGPLGQLRWAMSELGLYDPARDPGSTERRMSRKQRKALQETQSRHGLLEDAVVHPGGPTEELLNNMLAQGRSPWGSAGDHGLDSASRARREATPGALVGRVGPGRENHPDDVKTVSAALHHLDPSGPSTERPLRMPKLSEKLKEFQKGARLVPDGIITPGGPTERVLAEAVFKDLGQDRTARTQIEQLTNRIPPIPTRKPQTAPPAPARKPTSQPPTPPHEPSTREPDPNLGGIEPTFDPAAGWEAVKDTAEAIGIVSGLATAYGSPAAGVAALKTGAPALPIGFILGAFGNNMPPGVGQDPNLGP